MKNILSELKCIRERLIHKNPLNIEHDNQIKDIIIDMNNIITKVENLTYMEDQ